MLSILGTTLIYLAIVYIAVGLFGLYRFRDFSPRVLVASKIDTVGSITLMLGVILRSGLSFFSLKVMLVLLIILFVNPLSTHAIARSAYYSGYRPGKE